jgi:hypothetical protein
MDGGWAFSPSGEVAPLTQPQAALQAALAQLQRAALSQPKELDWQAQHEALRTLHRLARHHAGVLPPCLKALLGLAAPAIDALRSTLSRLAIAVFQVGWWGACCMCAVLRG